MLAILLDSTPQFLIAVVPLLARLLLKPLIQDWIFSGTRISRERDSNYEFRNARRQISFNIEYVALMGVTAIGLLAFTVHGLTTRGEPKQVPVAPQVGEVITALRVIWAIIVILFGCHFLWLFKKQPGGWPDIEQTPSWQRSWFRAAPIVIFATDKGLAYLIHTFG